MISKDKLNFLYVDKKLSSLEIAKLLDCSTSQVNYWLGKYAISKRSISEAVYQLKNPSGDPFKFNSPVKAKDYFLFGLGLGLFWGEGSKRNMHAVRLSNSDPALVKKFIDFLVNIYQIDRKKLKFQLQIYGDLNTNKMISFWAKYLSVKNTQFFKTIILEKRGQGTYLKKMKSGVIILHFGNTKLRNLICSQIANIENL